MLKEDLSEIFKRDIRKVISEINLYSNEENIWKVKEGVKNSAGNLCLHLTGNLKYFVGSLLGSLDYERNREAEFSNQRVQRKDIVRSLEETEEIVTATIRNLNEETLWENFPSEIFKRKVTTAYFLIHLTGHLNYHLGQISYHRRLFDR